MQLSKYTNRGDYLFRLNRLGITEYDRIVNTPFDEFNPIEICLIDHKKFIDDKLYLHNVIDKYKKFECVTGACQIITLNRILSSVDIETAVIISKELGSGLCQDFSNVAKKFIDKRREPPRIIQEVISDKPVCWLSPDFFGE